MTLVSSLDVIFPRKSKQIAHIKAIAQLPFRSARRQAKKQIGLVHALRYRRGILKPGVISQLVKLVR